MIIWFSLVAALAFGGQAHASHHMGMRDPQATTQAPATTSSTDAPVTTGSSATITPTFFHTNWNLPSNITFFQNATFGYTVTESLDESKNGNPVLVLCQTGASGPETLDPSNTWSVVQVIGTCLNNVNGVCSFGIGVSQTATIGFVPGQNMSSLDNFFLCFGSASSSLLTSLTCESYSPFFNIEPAGDISGTLVNVGPPMATPTVPIFLPKNTPVVNILGVSPTSASTSNYATEISVYLTATASSSQTPTQAASSSASPIAIKSKRLSTGALVGIIVGAVGGALILALLGLFCLRRRKHTRTRSNMVDSHTSFQPEHVLLTLPYQSVNGSRSRDITTEKDGSPTTLASILEIPLARPALPQNPRHSYDSLNASAPYSGLAAAAPKRKQAPPPPVAHNTHQQSLLSRGISDASGPLTRGLSDASGAISLRSTVRGEGEEFEEYHDVPIYGDARHTPTVYESHPSLLQAPFLSEEGMSAEEIARLEEEERRIDAAIEEAERVRR